jgi:hypothetical protein
MLEVFNSIKSIFKWVFGFALVKGEVERLKVDVINLKKEVRQDLLRIQWDAIYKESFIEGKLTDRLYQRACEIWDRYKALNGNWYVENEMNDLTCRFNKLPK